MTTTESGLHVGLEIVASLGKIHSELREMRRDARAQTLLPHMLRVHFADLSGNNGQYSTGVNTVLTADGPQLGKIWDVHLLALGGPKASTAGLTGTAYGFIGIAMPLDLSLEGLFAVNTTWSPTPPLTWGRGIVTVNPGENVYIVIVGGTNGATYGASMQVREYSRNKYLGAGQLGAD